MINMETPVSQEKIRVVNLIRSKKISLVNLIRLKKISTLIVKPAHIGQIRSQGKSTVRSKWPLKATETYEFFFPLNGNLY